MLRLSPEAAAVGEVEAKVRHAEGGFEAHAYTAIITHLTRLKSTAWIMPKAGLEPLTRS